MWAGAHTLRERPFLKLPTNSLLSKIALRPDNRRGFLYGVGLAASLLLLPLPSAFAQIPAQTNPGLLLPSPTEKVEQQRARKQQTDLSRPQESQEQSKLDIPEQDAVVEVESPTVQVQDIRIEGSTLLSQQEIAEATKEYIGKTVQIDELTGLVQKLNALYRAKGYVTTQAFIPPQDVSQGVLTIKVVEGSVGQVCISGNKYYSTKAIMRQLALKPGENLNLKALEKDLNESNFRNSYYLKATLTPGTTTGQTDIKLDVKERQPWQITPFFNNQGRPFIGLYQGGVEINNDSLFGAADRLATRFSLSDGTLVGVGSYFIPINSNGDEIGFSYGYSKVNVDLGTDPQPDITGRAHNFGFIYSHPFTRDRRWVGDVGINIKNVRSLIDGDVTSKDNIRSLQFGVNYTKNTDKSKTYVRVQTALGINNTLNDNSSFWKTEAFLMKMWALPKDNTLIFRAYGLLCPSDLPSAEQIQIGGAYSVRGYSEGLLQGDRGFNLTLEDRFPIPGLKNLSPWLAERVQGAAFIDAGGAWLDSGNPNFVRGLSDTSARTYLVGMGLGLRFKVNQYMMGFIDGGLGLSDRGDVEPNAQPTVRVHFGLRSNLLNQDLKERQTPTKCLEPKPKKVAVATPTRTPTQISSVPKQKSDGIILINRATSQASISKVSGSIVKPLPLRPETDKLY